MCFGYTGPQDEFHAAVKVLHNGRATVYPVTAIEVVHAINLLDHGPMDMATNGTIQTLLPGVANDSIFKIEDEAYSGLDLALGITS